MRPCWGKVCPIGHESVEALYPRLADFRRICDQFDPDGVFRNDWVRRVLFAESPVVSSA